MFTIQVTQLCFMLKAILKLKTDEFIYRSPLGSSFITQDHSSIKSVKVTDEMEAIFISALYSSLGAPLESNSRIIFDDFVKKISGMVKVEDTPEKRATFSELRFSFILMRDIYLCENCFDKCLYVSR